ncbi:C6 zinc finger domain-containing protein [Colletotrichum truncatum]|uniref:C6 zinc finger domain-containing protein n=1 Tax=Colletotrichum truncatum TaxID=5467 RepID=A0ACC3ZFF2_COLTU|nr:C6 zinc finger domain-containing protein [Colletotrichum truncatum]KAF6801737.1 C6 zinc finger domain-containing protein [Colletotrichum truncatum]
MDPGQPDSKRPRLSTTNSWSPTGAPQHQLPPLHPPSSLPPTPHQAHQPHHSAPPVPSYHHQHQHPHQQQQQQQQQPQPPPPPPYPPRSAEPHHSPHPAQHHPDERRHHDPEPPYAPMQDHYRHPPSPAHPSYSPFHHRDPGGVKREPHEENLSHPRRPHSTGGAPSDSLPPPGPHPPPHSAPPPPPVPPYTDDRRPPPPHMSYDNAPPQMPSTPGAYRGSYPPPPIPQQPQQQYEQPPYHAQPASEGIYNISYASTQKRKATRASQACDSCRQLKAKCDETKPCKSCREKGVECKYRDPVPKAIDKSQTDILEGIMDLKAFMEKKFESWERRLQTLENAPTSKHVKLEADTSASTPSPPRAKSHPSPENHYQHPQDRGQPEEMGPMAVGETDLAPPMPTEVMDDDLVPGPAVAPGAPSIPANHTTPQGYLLQWPAIKALTRKALQDNGVKYVEDFPIGREERRGLLRLFGRGEGNGHIFGYSSSAMPVETYGSVDSTDDNFGEPVASPSPGEAWGQVGSLSPPNLGYSSSTLTAEGHPDYSEEKVWSYVKSFEDHILIMHPIIMPSDLATLVKRFLENVALGDRKSKPQQPPGVAKFVPSLHAEMSNKRKRSPSGDQSEDPTQTPRRQGRPHRTIETALVLIVMALGKICQHKGKIPDPVADWVDNSQNSPMNRNGYPSSPGPSGQASPPSYSTHSQSSGLPSPKEQNNGIPGRRGSLQGAGSKNGGQSLRRNYDFIPGLEYMAVASDILGQHRSGYTLKHAQTFIFAGLYYGQLGRVFESHTYFLDADRSLYTIMRRDLDRFKKQVDAVETGHPAPPLSRRDNIVLLTYWTCLQLESDILAELSLPPSTVLSYEHALPWPNTTTMEKEFPDSVWKNYLAQLYLRKTLNQLHTTLYSPSDKDTPPMEKLQTALGLERTLRSLEWTQEELRFSEDDPPAPTLMQARLRAKYWGTQTIIYRPMIKMILDITEKLRQQSEGATPNSDTTSGLGLFAQNDATTFIGHGIGGYNDLSEDVIAYARRGIRALMKSTEAFHNVDSERLLVTNIFGTAHAQWGNLLILAAAYRDPFLHQFVDGVHLKTLFARTIKMLSMHAHATSALMVDKKILESIEGELFRHGFDDPRTTSSFSSTASMNGPTLPPPPPPPPTHQGPMSMAYAMEPNRSAHNSPSQGHRILNHGVNHNQNHGHHYQGQPTTM